MPRVVLKLSDDVSTDDVYPGRFMATVLPGETPQYAFRDNAEFNRSLREGRVPAGSVILAGRNFGCGSSREQAASALKGHELVVVAGSFARIFLQNAINLGLKAVTCREIDADEGDDLQFEAGAIVNLRTGRSFPVDPMPRARQSIIDAGGLVPYVRARLIEGGAS